MVSIERTMVTITTIIIGIGALMAEVPEFGV